MKQSNWWLSFTFVACSCVAIALYLGTGHLAELGEYKEWIMLKQKMRLLVSAEHTSKEAFRSEALQLTEGVRRGAAFEMLGELYEHLHELEASDLCREKAIYLTSSSYVKEKAVLGLINQWYTRSETLYRSKAIELAKHFLTISPNHPAALNFIALDAYEAGDYATAVSAWEKVREFALDWHLRSSLSQAILKAQEQLNPESIIAKVEVDFGIQKGVADPEDVLYIVIKQGHSAMPWIAFKEKVSDASSLTRLSADMRLYDIPATTEADDDYIIQAYVTPKAAPQPENKYLATVPLPWKMSNTQVIKLEFERGIANG